MKVLVTGGSGFIGKHVIQQLLEEGYEVRSFDLQPTPIKGAESYIGSIMDSNNLQQAIVGCTHVVHLAAMLGVKRTEIQRLGCLEVNIQGTRNVLDACVKQRIERIVFSSSSEVYGEPRKVPIQEDDEKHPISVYAITKLAGEEYLRAYKQQFGLDYAIVRFFNVYGPTQVAEFVLPRFVKAVQSGIAPSVYGSGEQKRAFCHVRDAARGVVLALSKAEASGQAFNIGNPDGSCTILELAELVTKAAGKDLKPEIISWQKADRDSTRDLLNRSPDITKARKLLGFEPTISLADGIRDVLEKDDIEETWFDPLIK